MNPEISVVLCTYNPRSDYLALALRSIGAQTLEYDAFEVVVVDNNSDPALDGDLVGRVCGREVTVIRETRQGLIHARVAGIGAVRGDLVVFVDDDNELSHGYLRAVREVAARHPRVGAFGGAAHGVFESPVGGLKRRFLPQLGIRDHGERRLEGPGSHWGAWEPIGAGLVVRRTVAEAFARFVTERDEAGLLGRSGASLMSGEDSLFSRLAHEQGLACAYEPALELRHYMAPGRLTLRYLAKLMYGHGRSFVVLAQLMGQPVDAPGARPRRWMLMNFVHRCRTEGPLSALGMCFWDAGFLDETGRDG